MKTSTPQENVCMWSYVTAPKSWHLSDDGLVKRAHILKFHHFNEYEYVHKYVFKSVKMAKFQDIGIFPNADHNLRFDPYQI